MSNEEFDALVVSPNCAIDSYYTLDNLFLEKVNRARNSFHTAGGKGINLSRAMGRLGGDPICLGIIGGKSGEYIKEQVKKEDIEFLYCFMDQETRRCNTFYIPNKTDTTTILDIGKEVSDTVVEDFRNLILLNLQKSKNIILTGSLLPGFSDDFHADIIKQAKLHNRRVFVDASGTVLSKALNSGPHFAKINRSEFVSVFSEEPFSVTYGKNVFYNLSKKGLEALIITDKEKGAYVFTSTEGDFQVNSKVNNLVSTAGSGDTFLAAFVLGLVNGSSIRQASTFAAAAAAANLSNLGCGFINISEVRNSLKFTEMTTLNV